ncbi:MAG: UDP-2,4-diacetamido-2,4,6-trideoxy-beta-L-altropyranose hydrolase [Brevundimonas sp.]|uniref:UDP-2,4-diacetamido-2,4, 6-trideoxy-beta-L-altropyranose hydrolase n=1 Tax=Brevundimonas sp. TaxID=1871086 RepID=UPI00248A583F|nr:UDP-2,4-diacetamido-2,4,6-trideoxy-beta-L-altropyranose hydrolase [Brevundimonas sp.]MDI1325514.1 UDP-2,4-diacetamido-2,4,6-trideoxy-beta-L-altropyranose hydrolase [Brevundimonas sp.]
MRFVFRVDASSEIGTGHLRRCLSLAHEIRTQGLDVLFVCRQHDFDYGPLFLRESFEFVALPPAPEPTLVDPDAPAHARWARADWSFDAAETIAATQAGNVDWVIVDHYAFDARWHAKVGEALQCRLAVIDDLADRSLLADVVIDHNFHPDHQAKYRNVMSGIGCLLAGPRYALISNAYAETPKYAFRDDVASIGIFLGGIDLLHVTPVALDAVRAAGFEGVVEIALTSANPDVASIQAMADSDGRCSLSIDLPDLARFFARHDLQIGAGGGAIWERCCMGAPTIGLVCAENQRYSLPYLHDEHVLLAVDILAVASECRLRHISHAVMTTLSQPTLRREMSETASRLVDGLGVARITRILATEFSGHDHGC